MRAGNGRMAGIAVVLAFLICSSLWSFGFGTEPPIRPLGSDSQEDLFDTFPPTIILTSPAHEELDVYLYAPIVIQFNESMNTSSFSYEFLFGTDPGMTWTWESTSFENDTVRGTHTNAFYPAGYYVFNVTYAEDPAGNPLVPGPVPNPWNWTVEAEPVIIQTIPADGETNVSLTQPIIVHFYGPLVPIQNITIEILPELGPRTEEWSMDMLIIYHLGFLPCTIYMVGVYIGGFPFPIPFPSLVPNPWHFTTTCHPVITETDPPDGSINTPPDYPINVTFSRPMNTTSVNWTIDPHLDLTPSWSENDTLLTLSHTEQFNMLTLYTMEITQGRDKEGNDLVWGLVPNPWSFSTTCIQTYISFTDPSHQETNVSVNRSIIVGFVSCMEPSSLSWTIDPFIDLTPNWSNDNTLLEFTHVSDFENCTEYTMEVYAEDEYGNPLLPGPVPNPWNWTTIAEPLPPPPPPAPPRNTTAYLSGPQLRDVTLSWLLSVDDFPGGNVSHYDMYRRADAYNGSGLGYSYLASVPKGVSAFVDQSAGQDTHSYYYFVCAVNVNGSTCASDQAGKFFRALDTGPQLVSVPIIPQDESIGTVLQTARFDNAWYYDSSRQSWKWYMKGKSYEGELRTIDNTMGLWVNVTSSSNLVVAGSVPSSTSVTLRKGWNLVSFPSLDEGFTVSDLKAAVGATRVEGFSPTSPYLLRVLEDWVTLASGFGYWVKVEEDTMWTVSNK